MVLQLALQTRAPYIVLFLETSLMLQLALGLAIVSNCGIWWKDLLQGGFILGIIIQTAYDQSLIERYLKEKAYLLIALRHWPTSASPSKCEERKSSKTPNLPLHRLIISSERDESSCCGKTTFVHRLAKWSDQRWI